METLTLFKLKNVKITIEIGEVELNEPMREEIKSIFSNIGTSSQESFDSKAEEKKENQHNR